MATQNYMTCQTKKRKLMALLTIKSLEEQLPGTLEKVTSLRGNKVIIGSHNIPIGKNYKDQLLKIVNDRLIGK
jgi:hypothetical protein